MSPTDFGILLVLIGALWPFHRLCKTIFSMTSRSHHKPPPGPLRLPIIGHLHMLGKLPHHTLYKLSQKYGPIMSLRLGSIPTIVVSSPDAAELFLKTHDAVFASRPKAQVAETLWYGTKAMIFTEYGAYWRNVRKFCTLELLSVSKIDSFAERRREELELLVISLKKSARAGEVVDISKKVAHLTVDMTCKMLFGKVIDDNFKLNEIIHEMAEIMGAFNIADFVPLLGALDLQGLTRQIKAISKAVDKILETIIDEHEQDAINGNNELRRDFVDVILSLKNSQRSTHEQLAQNLDRSNIKAILLDMIFGSIDTSQISIEWIMSELIRHPRVMKRLQKEISNVISDLPRANHLLAVPSLRFP
ncbi:putative flavonoid 3',5'-hydroxylase [Heracleum sosnowskyi]|uniref:Flavonoid 3',5'-hydroxylase n=1 Tax=Heracleum sosnowskyi TaxID=360622 RepID=A0AAD8GZ06_9APIA|nr:putative flavonoid 3',5'-hydroxylase [Heracleum sosnowskyi]